MVAAVTRPLTLAFVCLCSIGCARKGPEANQTYFWQVTSSNLEWGACGDSATLRGGVMPIAIAANSFLIYKVDSTGKKGVSQSCPRLDVGTCTDSATNIVFDIVGTELTYTSERKDPVQGSACKVQQNETWTLADKITTITLEIDTVLSLVGSDTDCPKLEANVKADSPNGLGVGGCVLTRKLEGTLN